jgi:hypothetical protein
MSLLSTDISKVNRISLKEVGIPAPERKTELISPPPIERPISPLLEALNQSIQNKPIFRAMVESLDLSVTRLRKIEDVESEYPKKGNKDTVGDWDNKIQALESFFTSLKAPDTDIKINKGSTILDLKKITESHLIVIKANNGKKLFLPYLERLEKVREVIEVNTINKII